MDLLATARNLLHAHGQLGTVTKQVDEVISLGAATEMGAYKLDGVLQTLRRSAAMFDEGATALGTSKQWPTGVARTGLEDSAGQLRLLADQLEGHATPFYLASGMTTAQRHAMFGASHLIERAALAAPA